MKNYLIGACVLLSVVTGAAWMVTRERYAAPFADQLLSSTKHPLQTGKPKEPAPSGITPKCQVIEPLYDPRRLYVKPDLARREALLARAFMEPTRFIAEIGSDPEAYLALFALASTCFPDIMHPGKTKRRFIENCPNVVVKLPGHPIELLQRAAEFGSVDAKLIYALNARMYARYYRPDGQNGAGDSVRDVLERAERFGVEAAQAGHPDAYRYMSDAYQNGVFGRPDFKLALAFSLPLLKIGEKSDRPRIDGLYSKVTNVERNSAEKHAFGCGADLLPSSLVSPF